MFAGAVDRAASPAAHFSPILGADLQVHPGETATIPLDPACEHGVLVLSGNFAFERQPLETRTLYYLGTRRTEAEFSTREGGRVLIVGGPPFPETIVMWWNFVARTPGEIAEARADWEAHRRFGEVARYDGPRLDAPELVRLARPNPVS